MFDRVMAAGFFVAALMLASVLYHDRYAAPACHADAVVSAVLQQVQGEGQSAAYLSDARPRNPALLAAVRGYFEPHRACVGDLVPNEDLSATGRGAPVFYQVERDGRLSVQAQRADPAGPRLAGDVAAG